MLATPLVGSPKWKTKVYSYIIVASKNGKSRCTIVANVQCRDNALPKLVKHERGLCETFYL